MTYWLLKLHRWLALLFALPLAIVIVTGLILSFEPAVTVATTQPGHLSVAKIEAALAQHDPSGKAKALTYRSYDGTLTIGGGRGNPGVTLSAATGEKVPGPGALSGVFGTSRFLHEHLLLDGSWLVTASTIAMLLLIGLGLFMGWPRFANSLSGWHRGTAWVVLPLLVLSPLTGLALAFGITFSDAPTRATAAPVSLVEAVRNVGRGHDLAGLLWLRERRGQMLARIVEDGEYRVYAVTASGTEPVQRNWPRLIHEGNWMGHVSAGLNVVTSLAFAILLVTGIWIWGRRQLRRRRNLAARAAMAS